MSALPAGEQLERHALATMAVLVKSTHLLRTGANPDAETLPQVLERIPQQARCKRAVE